MIIVDEKELNKAFTLLNRIIPKNDILFGNVKLWGENGELTLVGNKGQGSDIVQSIQVKIDCLGELDPVVIPFVHFSRRYGSQVEISRNGKSVQVKSGNLKLDLPTVTKFPQVEFDENVVYEAVNPDDLKTTIKRLENATGGVENKYNTVYFRDNEILASSGQVFTKINQSFNYTEEVLIDKLQIIPSLIGKKDQISLGQSSVFLYVKLNDNVVVAIRGLGTKSQAPVEPKLDGETQPIETNKDEFLNAIKDSIGENVALVLEDNQISILSSLNVAQSEIVIKNVQSTTGYIKLPKKTLETLLNTMSDDVFKGEIVLNGNYQILRVLYDDFVFYVAGLVR